jgi:glycosyltransferase involved in cell wall biosynthesis
MTIETTISVIIATYDRARMLREAVESVLAQTFQPLEIILVPNGASAETKATVDDLCRRHQLVRKVETARGLTLARNAGLAAARGHWIAFLDDDDLWLPEKLATQIEAATTTGADVIGYSRISFNELGDIAGSRPLPPPTDMPLRDAILLRRYHLAIPSLIRADALKSIGGFDEKLSAVSGEDLDMCWRLALNHSFYHVDKVLVRSRRHSGNSTTRRMSLYSHIYLLTKWWRLMPAHLRHRLPSMTLTVLYHAFPAYYYTRLDAFSGRRLSLMVGYMRKRKRTETSVLRHD